jgi:hypothetical protein
MSQLSGTAATADMSMKGLLRRKRALPVNIQGHSFNPFAKTTDPT